MGNYISSGEIHVNYDFLTQTLEITFLSKLKQEISENIFGIKYSITSRKIDFGYVCQVVSSQFASLELPELVSSVVNVSFEAIRELFAERDLFEKLRILVITITLFLFCLIITALIVAKEALIVIG